MGVFEGLKNNANFVNVYLISVVVDDMAEYHIAFNEYEDFVEFMSEHDFSEYEGTGASYKLYEGVIDLSNNNVTHLIGTGYCFIESNDSTLSLDGLEEVAQVSLNEPFQPYDYTDERSFLWDLKNQLKIGRGQSVEFEL